ncbi:hypothetical protein LEP1GSC111_4046 [Leptospira interrogans str. UT126]|nr:hypothetical protein LEP1GSC111_4046 [Leptospira interrogans str. UT126]EMN68362.1 hypothetical protein LEP1GSC098_2230 [Leptospira interrogans serovar Grippotyphosa str. UI 08434]
MIFYRKIRLYKTNFLYRYNKEAVLNVGTTSFLITSAYPP